VKRPASLVARAAAPLLALALLAACAKGPAPEAAAPHKHVHHPPHGGTAVVLGDEAYHMELVLDPAAGVLQAYILDGELENFIRSAAASIEIDATVGGSPKTLVLEPVPNSATGETVGDTSLFQAHSEWLRSAKEFDGVVKSVTIRGTAFEGVRFNFPKGNDTD
jgi:hypothetical protein